MTSKKKRKKLKEIYNTKNNAPNKIFLRDRELLLNYFKNHPNEVITSDEIIDNNNLEFRSKTGLYKTIKAINYYTDLNIKTIKGRNGGYIYYE